MTQLVLGSDHGGLELKTQLKTYLQAQYPHLTLEDVGTYSNDSCDYPDYADSLCESILSGQSQLGILCCGTGIGISMRANRHKGIRAAVVHSEFTAKMTKAHNNANVLCLGGRTSTIEDAQSWVSIWLDTEFEGGRHQRRLEGLDKVTS